MYYEADGGVWWETTRKWSVPDGFESLMAGGGGGGAELAKTDSVAVVSEKGDTTWVVSFLTETPKRIGWTARRAFFRADGVADTPKLLLWRHPVLRT